MSRPGQVQAYAPEPQRFHQCHLFGLPPGRRRYSHPTAYTHPVTHAHSVTYADCCANLTYWNPRCAIAPGSNAWAHSYVNASTNPYSHAWTYTDTQAYTTQPAQRLLSCLPRKQRPEYNFEQR